MRSGNRVRKPKLRRKYSEGFGGGSTWIMMSKMPGELMGQTFSCKMSQSGQGHSQEMHCTSTGKEICQNLNLFQIFEKLEGIKAIRTKSHDSHSVVCMLPAEPLSLLPHSSAALTICSLRAQLLHHIPSFASPDTPPKPEVECKALLAAKAHLAQASASLSANSVSDQWRWQCFASKSIKYDGYTTRTSKDRTGRLKMK